MAKDRKAKTINGVSFNPDAFPDDITEEQFVDRAIKTKKFAKQQPDEAKQRELAKESFNHLYGKKKQFQENLSDSLVKKGNEPGAVAGSEMT